MLIHGLLGRKLLVSIVFFCPRIYAFSNEKNAVKRSEQENRQKTNCGFCCGPYKNGHQVHFCRLFLEQAWCTIYLCKSKIFMKKDISYHTL